MQNNNDIPQENTTTPTPAPTGMSRRNEKRHTGLFLLSIIAGFSIWGWARAVRIHGELAAGKPGADEMAKQFIDDAAYAFSIMTFTGIFTMALL